jgi:hypothetical protein
VEKKEEAWDKVKENVLNHRPDVANNPPTMPQSRIIR